MNSRLSESDSRKVKKNIFMFTQNDKLEKKIEQQKKQKKGGKEIYRFLCHNFLRIIIMHRIILQLRFHFIIPYFYFL